MRFAILDGPILVARNHFVQTVNGKSCRLCLSENGTPAWCCNKLGEDGRLRIISLALLYENADKRGGYPKNIPIEWRVGFVELSSSHFKVIRGLVPEGAEGVAPGRVTDIDCGMVLDKNRYAFKLISLKARWKQIPELAKEVKAAVAKALSDGGRRLEKRLGRKTSPIEWKQLLAERTAEPATVDNLEDNPF